MNQLPEWRPMLGQPRPLSDEAAAAEAKRIIREALQEEPARTSYRDDRPLPVTGTAPPVAQPGRPPMSQRATDASALMLSGGVASLLVGGSASLVMLASGYADPVVCGIVTGAPAVLVLTLSRLARRAKEVVEAVPPVIHQTYTGNVQQHSQTVHSQSRLWGKSTTNL
jgi:hypothetical protein